jgi:hypothetical protein
MAPGDLEITAAPAAFSPAATPGRVERPWSVSVFPIAASSAQSMPGQASRVLAQVAARA